MKLKLKVDQPQMVILIAVSFYHDQDMIYDLKRKELHYPCMH